MPKPNRGELWLVRFPFTDLSSSKLRPALIWAVHREDVIVLGVFSKLSTRAGHKTWVNLEEHDLEFSQTGLKKSSLLKAEKIAVIHKSVLQRKLGKLSSNLMGKVQEALKKGAFHLTMNAIFLSIKDRWQTRAVVYRQIFGLLVRYPAISLSLIAVSITASVASVLQIGLVIPILQDAQSGSSSLEQLPLLGYFGQLASDMDAVGRIRFVAISLIVITVIQGTFTYASNLLSTLLQIKVDRGLRSQVFEQLLDVELRFIHREQMGNLFTILNTYTSNVGALIVTVSGAFLSLFTVVMYAAALVLVSWQLTVLALILLLLVFVVIRKRFSARIGQVGQ